MPFDITLMPADVEAALPPYQASIEAAVRANGGRIGPGDVVRLADGGEFVVGSRGFSPKKLSQGVCRVIFDAALASNTYVDTDGSDVTPLKIKGSALETPPEVGPSVVVENPRALCARLQGRFARWNREMGRLRAEGVIGPDDQPLEPPPAPGEEPRLTNDLSGVASKCEALSRKLASDLGWRFVRGLVTQNAQWGVVWRADIAPEADPKTWTRESCWRPRRAKAHGQVSFSTRPLQMFDETKSVGPLPSD